MSEFKIDFKLTKEKRDILKDLLVKYGFLIRYLIKDPEFVQNFPSKHSTQDKITGIKSNLPISYPTLLWLIENDEDLRKFRDDNLELIYHRLFDSAYGLAEGIQYKSHVSANVRLEAIKYVMKIIKPELFKNDSINIQNNIPSQTMFFCEDVQEQTVSEFLNEKNKS